MLISDVDGTMLGDHQGLEQFVKWYGEHRDTMRLVYASGRFCDSIAKSVQTTPLPEPHAIIGGVGTDICLYPAVKPLTAWHERINRNWGAQRVREVLSRWDRLEPQPKEHLSPFKVSYYVHDASSSELSAIQEELRVASLDVRIIYSSKRDLDVVPAAADKGKAAAFLASLWGMAPERVMVSGDTGNDRALFEQGFRGIVVANALPELKRLRGPEVYHARQAFAAGVLEGVLHWRERM